MAFEISERLAANLWRTMHELGDDQLQQVMADREGMTKTNCYWVAYGLKDMLHRLARVILYHREKSANKAAGGRIVPEAEESRHDMRQE